MLSIALLIERVLSNRPVVVLRASRTPETSDRYLVLEIHNPGKYPIVVKCLDSIVPDEDNIAVSNVSGPAIPERKHLDFDIRSDINAFLPPGEMAEITVILIDRDTGFRMRVNWYRSGNAVGLRRTIKLSRIKDQLDHLDSNYYGPKE
jgi:hypothetical protein